MTLRFYLVPMVRGGRGWTAKYFHDSTITWQAINYGLEPVMLVSGTVTEAQHASFMALNDVYAFPGNIAGNVREAEVAGLMDMLEAYNIPGTYVNSGMTFTLLIRRIVGLFHWAQCYFDEGGGRLVGDNGLDTRFDLLPLQSRERMIIAGARANLDLSGINGEVTMRQVARQLANQADRPVVLGRVI